MVTEAPTPSAMIRAVAASSYQQLLEREYPNWRDRLEDIEQFALFAEGYESLESFLADVSLYDDVLAKREEYGPNDDERMVLSTVHQSKGLEWDTVFILHLADGAFPNGRALAEENGIEEERRLFYVAVTRARRRLFLSYPLTMGHDSLVLNRPSQFLDEIDPRLTERIELVDAYRAKPPPDHGWNWDLSGSEDVIELDALGEPRASASSRTAWKASTKSANKPPRELLPPV
jgi:DNA helicase-2/ATP-dependent DNA helicase PcrA